MFYPDSLKLMHSETKEAKAVRERRRVQRRNQPDDVLAERAKNIAFWRECAKTNPACIPHNGAWWWAFTWNPVFRRLLLPGLRARQDARDHARRAQFTAELRESSRQYAQVKAERVAAKARAKLPQFDMFDRNAGAAAKQVK